MTVEAEDPKSRNTLLEMTPIENPPPVLAIVIGINNYESDMYPNLNGASMDADSFELFLVQRMQVPKENIRSLRDEQASRTAIIDAFLFLLNNEKYKRDEAAIIIYFAGHGAATTKPIEWEDWDTTNGSIEMLCPSDIMEDGTKVVPGIPDRTISALLNQIADRSGHNILYKTVILDCCSSAGMTRGSRPDIQGEYAVRNIDNPPQITYDCDHQLWPAGSKIKNHGLAGGFTPARFQGSHVLLAACGSEQFAYESQTTKQGLFTSALLKLLASEEFESYTYISLMDKLPMSRRQTPHCEGEGKIRRLFNHKGGGADTSLIYTKRSKDGTITLEAGTMHGITAGSRFSVHRNNLIDTPLIPNPCIGYLEAISVDRFFSRLKLPRDMTQYSKPWSFYCKSLNSGSAPISLFSKNMDWLETIYPPAKCTALSVILVDNVEKSDLELTLRRDSVYFDRYNPMVTPHIGPRIRHTVTADNTDAIHNVVKASAHFYHHLTRISADDFKGVRMEMYALEEEIVDAFDVCLKPHGPNLIAQEPATVVVDDRPLGMTIFNEGKSTLYPYLFYFDPTDLTITNWYSPPIGAGFGRHIPNRKNEPSPLSPLNMNLNGARLNASGVADACLNNPPSNNTTMDSHPIETIGLDASLPPNSRLAVGYGTGGSEPWEFVLPEGEDKDIGFIRLFLSNRPTSFQNILQSSPFEVTRDIRTISVDTDFETSDLWTVKTATVIQVKDRSKN